MAIVLFIKNILPEFQSISRHSTNNYTIGYRHLMNRKISASLEIGAFRQVFDANRINGIAGLIS